VIKREHRCKSGAIPVAVSSDYQPAAKQPLPFGGKALLVEQARRPALNEFMIRAFGKKAVDERQVSVR